MPIYSVISLMDIAGQKESGRPSYSESEAQLEILAGLAVIYLVRVYWQDHRWPAKAARNELSDHAYATPLKKTMIQNYLSKVVRFAEKAMRLSEDPDLKRVREAGDAKSALDAMLAFFAGRQIRKPFHIVLWAESENLGPLDHKYGQGDAAKWRGGPLPCSN